MTNTQVQFAVNTGEDVFEAIVPTCIVALKKHKLISYDIPVADLRGCEQRELSRRLDVGSFTNSTKDIVLATPNSIFAFDLDSTALVNKLAAKFAPFGDCCDDVANGISTSCDEIYIVTHKLAESEAFEKNYLKQCIRGGQFNRFYCPPTTRRNTFSTSPRSSIQKSVRTFTGIFQQTKHYSSKNALRKRKKRGQDNGTCFFGRVTKVCSRNPRF